MAALMRCRILDKVPNTCSSIYSQQLNYSTNFTVTQTDYDTGTESSTYRGRRRKEERPHYAKVKPKIPPGSCSNMNEKLSNLWEKDRMQLKTCPTPAEQIHVLTKRIFKTWKFPPINPAPESLKYQQGVTKTIIKRKLPDYYKAMNVEDDIARVKEYIIESLELEKSMNRLKFQNNLYRERMFSSTKTRSSLPYENSRLQFQSLLTEILGLLVGKHKHVDDCLIDRDVSVGACFSRDGVLRSRPYYLKKNPPSVWTRQNNTQFQGLHNVDFQIRRRVPLPQFGSFISVDKNEMAPRVPYQPKFLGQFEEHMQRKITSGFNLIKPASDPHAFTHLSVVFSNHTKLVGIAEKYGEQYAEEAIEGYGLVTSFLSAVAQAHMLGFNQYQDLTYPITTQTILTDGQNFKMCAFQLNTLALWKCDDSNAQSNIFWMDETKPLYEGFEDDRLVGFNEDLLSTLLKFFTIQPTTRGIKDLHPNVKLNICPSYTPDIQSKKKVVTIVEPLVYDR